VHTLPAVPPVLKFIQQHAGMDDREAYGTLNMGAGFALFIGAAALPRTLEVARGLGLPAWHAGQVDSGDKELLIEPLGLRFAGDELQLR
jgi:phosphoribosylformylglycinamidine cyclo-ligase